VYKKIAEADNGRSIARLPPLTPLVSDKGVEILVVSTAEADYTCFSHILSHSRWGLHRVVNCREAVAFLERRPLGVVICDVKLADGSWKDLLGCLAALPFAPNLIVSSRLADEQLWAEVLNLGGYDVLTTPYDTNEVFRVGSAAWLDWKRRLGTTPTPNRRAHAAGNPGRPFGGPLAAAGA